MSVLPTKKEHKKRLKEWADWLANFKKQIPKDKRRQFSYIPHAAWLLNDLYWKLAEQYIRPVLENNEERRIHPYKIISASEIAVMMTEPIIAEDDESSKRFNASLAWFIATQIIEGWSVNSAVKITAGHINNVAGYKEYIEDGKRYPNSFATEHLTWLSMLNVTIEKPLLLNAQCWRLFYISCLALAGNGKLN